MFEFSQRPEQKNYDANAICNGSTSPLGGNVCRNGMRQIKQNSIYWIRQWPVYPDAFQMQRCTIRRNNTLAKAEITSFSFTPDNEIPLTLGVWNSSSLQATSWALYLAFFSKWSNSKECIGFPPKLPLQSCFSSFWKKRTTKTLITCGEAYYL